MKEPVTIELDFNDPKVQAGLAKISKSMDRWKKNLERGRQRARAYINLQRIKRGEAIIGLAVILFSTQVFAAEPERDKDREIMELQKLLAEQTLQRLDLEKMRISGN